MNLGPDPFEEEPSDAVGAATRTGAAPEANSMRETIVQQAVTFLTDARVKAADPRRAVDFLLGKNLTVAEIREAFRRVNMNFPGASELLAPSNFLLVPPGARVSVRPGQPRSSWVSLFWGLTAAAGFIAVVRELLRRYVVPLYFPESGRLTIERLGPESSRARYNDEEIGNLRAAVEELARSSRQTSERMDRLSMTISSSGVLDILKSTSDATMQDTSRQTGGSATASMGTVGSRADSMRSRGVLERLDELRVEVNNLKLLSGQRSKEGSLSYGGTSRLDRDEFFTPLGNRRLSSERGGHETASRSAGAELSGNSSSTTQRSITFAPDGHSRDDPEKKARRNGGAGVSGGREGSSAAARRIGSAEVDDFMTLEPARVEQSWLTRSSSTGGVDLVPDGGKDMLPTVDGVYPKTGGVGVNGDVSVSRVNTEEQVDRLLSGSAGAGGAGGGDTISQSELTEEERRFREDMLAESEMVRLSTEELDANGFVARRPLSVASAPAPDTALSDAEM